MQGATLGNYAATNALGTNPNVVEPVVPTDTLLRAISSLDELNKRLEAMRAGTYQIAEVIGGPYPVTGQASGQQVGPPSAMARLNRGIEEAHRTLSDLDDALMAIRRSLGA